MLPIFLAEIHTFIMYNVTKHRHFASVFAKKSVENIYSALACNSWKFEPNTLQAVKKVVFLEFRESAELRMVPFLSISFQLRSLCIEPFRAGEPDLL
jgi:hypothetical protein